MAFLIYWLWLLPAVTGFVTVLTLLFVALSSTGLCSHCEFLLLFQVLQRNSAKNVIHYGVDKSNNQGPVVLKS